MMVTGGVIGSSGSGLDDDLVVFLQQTVNTFVKWDLIRFFHDNPHTQDTATSIASYIGRDVNAILPDLQSLAAAGVLLTDALTPAGVQLYRLTDDATMQNRINRFMESCHDRQFRMQAIHQVMYAMQSANSRRG